MGKTSNNTPAYNGNRPYIFISYSHRDTAKVVSLIAAMQNRGYRVWYDQGIEGGSEWANNIANHLRNCSAFVAFISHNSMASENCLDEISYAKSNNKPSLMIFLEEQVELPEGTDMQTARFQRMYYTQPDSAKDFAVQLQEAQILAPCCGEDALEYYNDLKKNSEALHNDLEIVAARKHQMLDHVDQFVITQDNEELFRQAEILYARWLFNKDGKVTIAAVDQAVKLCRQSAEMGNPKALARLAYFYDKDYIVTGGNELMRFKIAYGYYSMICYSGISEIEIQSGCPYVSWKNIRENTARAMLRMLSRAPAELQESNTYNFKTNCDRVHMELGLSETVFS
ncbi:MAG: toll/interleukin-1 receptor domain-containing protein [Clostridia bacterium]|nr:toll/interleukin-1 receptor domain-containing protein [Clostridia bacterium]